MSKFVEATISIEDEVQVIQWLNERRNLIIEESRQRLEEARKKNELLSAQIEEQSNKSLMHINSSFTINQICAETLQTCNDYITTKLQQIKRAKETIEDKMNEEAERSRRLVYEMLLRDDVALQPYHDVETATEDLIEKTEQKNKDINDIKEARSKSHCDIKNQFAEIIQNYNSLEMLTKELCWDVTNGRSKLIDNEIFILNGDFESDDEELDSLKIQELNADIANIEAELSKYSETI
ncbi:uncharacterized protein LOC142238728 [Haematobia irritans]|uniref:uncharacterized protein LOC142238728 n=1 Tax=Haematobia irritans TaxID=7368 RepID=UPI003F50216B